MRIKIITIVGIVITTMSCHPDIDYNLHGYTQKIIVEASISSGEYAKVYLSFNYPLSQTFNKQELLMNSVRNAKVTITDGETTEILTGGFIDTTHFPAYYYATTSLKGIEGKKYSLTIDYSGYTIVSTTSIPLSDSVVSFSTEPVNDSMRILKVRMKTKMNGSYKISSLKGVDGYFIETPILYNENLDLNGINTFQVSPSPLSSAKSYKEGGLFKKGNQVLIRISKIDSTSTSFYKRLTITSQNGLGGDIFIGEKETLKSNVTVPGFGIWCGMATQYFTVDIE